MNRNGGLAGLLQTAAEIIEQSGGHHYVAHRLRIACEYHKMNPLGGPASMFDAIAARIRAGEDVDECLRDYGLRID